MTLQYWWMHWFWITSRIILALTAPSPESEEVLYNQHSTIPPSDINNNNNNSNNLTRSAKSIGISNLNPPISVNVAPSNASALKPKPSPKKFANMTTKHYHQLNKEVTVIANTTEIGLNMTDNNQTLLISPVNHTENYSYINETNYNQSLFLTSEKMMEKDANDIPDNLSAAGITGITLGCVVIVGVICGISYFLYRNRGFNRPQVLNDRCSNPDSSGYIDDASVRDNSEEMYSLDNDSFLNSLEAMTIQNYWTDTVKHTKL